MLTEWRHVAWNGTKKTRTNKYLTNVLFSVYYIKWNKYKLKLINQNQTALDTEMYSEPHQTTKMGLFVNAINGFKL